MFLFYMHEFMTNDFCEILFTMLMTIDEYRTCEGKRHNVFINLVESNRRLKYQLR